MQVGLGYLALALTYFLCDFWRVWSGNPFRIVGMNSIAVRYCAAVGWVKKGSACVCVFLPVFR